MTNKVSTGLISLSCHNDINCSCKKKCIKYKYININSKVLSQPSQQSQQISPSRCLSPGVILPRSKCLYTTGCLSLCVVLRWPADNNEWLQNCCVLTYILVCSVKTGQRLPVWCGNINPSARCDIFPLGSTAWAVHAAQKVAGEIMRWLSCSLARHDEVISQRSWISTRRKINDQA